MKTFSSEIQLQVPVLELTGVLKRGGWFWGGGADVRPAGKRFKLSRPTEHGYMKVSYFKDPAAAVGAYVVAVGGWCIVTVEQPEVSP